MTAAAETQSLKRTPLYPLHRELGARMGPFAGYVMPIHYPLGVLKEHLHTRQAAGLFDISHMGQIALHPKTDLGLLVAALERLLPIDVVGLQPGRQRYGFLTNIQGGIIDDCIVANRGDCFLLVVNANRKNVDELHLRTRLVDVGTVEPVSERALLAVQGPAAETVLARLAPFIKNMRFMDITEVTLAGVTAVVSRSGYTGEDGFEISVPAEQAEKLARLLLQHREVAFIGLGARDSLRTEAGLCLYGADLNEATTPVEAGLEWAIQRIRRRGGGRAGGFFGADIVLRELERGPRRRRVGLLPQERVPVRRGASLFSGPSADTLVGSVTSGLYGPSVGAPVAMGYVDPSRASPGTRLWAEVRGKTVPVLVTTPPFVPHRYKTLTNMVEPHDHAEIYQGP
jgi:aminomethyltransferase